MDVSISSAALDTFQPLAQVAELGQLVFYQQISAFLTEQIGDYQDALLLRVGGLVSGVALVLLTIWIMLQGYRIITGQSREPMMAFIASMAKAVFVLSLAFGMSTGGGRYFFEFLSEDLPAAINGAVSGEETDPADQIDRNLGYMQLALSSIDLVQTGGSQALERVKSRTMWFAGIGTAGPAIVGGAMLLLNKIAMALFIGFGPFFIMCLLFDSTKSLFMKWLMYGIGTMFSLAVLSVMVAIATEMVIRVSAYFWASSLLSSLTGSSTEGLSSMALQQGGMGLILTTMIVSAPPMAAAFFQGVLGQFSAYSAFGGSATAGARGPGSPPVVPTQAPLSAHAYADTGGAPQSPSSPLGMGASPGRIVQNTAPTSDSMGTGTLGNAGGLAPSPAPPNRSPG